MLPMRELFYGKAEPVWILNHARDDDEDEEESRSTDETQKGEYSTSSGTSEVEKQEYPTVTTSPYYPYYSPYFPYPYQTDPYHFGLPDNSYGSAKKETEVVMKIPICCSGCEDSIKVPLNAMEGVNSVECNILRKKVTVVVTKAAPADILMECRKVFKESRMWNEDD